MDFTTSGVALLYLIGVLILTILVTRWIFSIDTILKNQRKTNNLLAQIAAKQGVPVEEINSIMSE